MNVNQGTPHSPTMDRAQVERSLAELSARGLVGDQPAPRNDEDVFTRDIGSTLTGFLPPQPASQARRSTVAHPAELQDKLAHGGATAMVTRMLDSARILLRQLAGARRAHVDAGLEEGCLKVHARVFEARDGERVIRVDHRAATASPLRTELRDAFTDITALAAALSHIEHLRAQLPPLSAEAEATWRELHGLRVRVTADRDPAGAAPDVLLDAFLRDIRAA